MSSSAECFLPGQLATDGVRLQDAIARAVAQSGQTREQIAAKMSELTRDQIPPTHLRAYEDCGRMPMAYARAFCAATGDYTLLLMLAEGAGIRMVRDDEWKLLQWAKRQLEIRRLQAECEAIAAEIEEFPQ
jgi:hypothetical protein